MVPVLKEHLPLSHSPDEALTNPSSGGVCGKEGRGPWPFYNLSTDFESLDT